MKLKWISLVCAFAAAFVFIPALSRADVKDNASIFSKQAVDDADRAMKKMKEKHNKEFVVETFSAIPDDQKDNYTQHPDTFFKDWMAARAKELKVNGVYALICMDPHHLEVGAGKNTISRGDFTQADVDGLYSQMKESLKAKDYDKALTDAVDTVERAYTANISEPNSRSSYNQRETGYSGGNNRSYGSGFPSNLPTHTSSTGLGFGTIICFVVGAVIIFSLIKSIFRGNSGGGYNQGGWGQGGNYGGGNYGNQSYGGGFGGGVYLAGDSLVDCWAVRSVDMPPISLIIAMINRTRAVVSARVAVSADKATTPAVVGAAASTRVLPMPVRALVIPLPAVISAPVVAVASAAAAVGTPAVPAVVISNRRRVYNQIDTGRVASATLSSV
jgi:hypothetical protein